MAGAKHLRLLHDGYGRHARAIFDLETKVTEEWRRIEGHPGYWVSNQGRVKWRDRVRALTPDSNGYLRVSFWENGKAKKVAAHILVAAAFLGPRPPGMQIRHRDGVNSHNAANNLTYGTQAENEADKALHGTANRGEAQHSAKITAADVVAIRKRYRPRDPQNSLATIGKEYGICNKTVEAIVKRQTWKHVH